MIITEQTINTFQSESGLCLYFAEGLRSFSYDYKQLRRKGLTPEKMACLEILGFTENDEYVHIKFMAPKTKEITVSYLFNKIAKYAHTERAYKNLSAIFKKLLPSYNFYETSYGIGMEALFLTHEQVLKRAQPLCDFLNSIDLKFETEYSDASWVYRFKISKSKDNLEKINNYAKNLC